MLNQIYILLSVLVHYLLINHYLSEIKTSKNGEHIFYEDVLQWGAQQDFYDRETREKAKKALTKYIETFEERNPNLKLIGAYIHMDEAYSLGLASYDKVEIQDNEDFYTPTSRR